MEQFVGICWGQNTFDPNIILWYYNSIIHAVCQRANERIFFTMEIKLNVNSDNTKNILDLLEEQGISLPCNCHGENLCGGSRYSFPCGMIPKEPITIPLPESSSIEKMEGIDLMQTPNLSIMPDTLLIDLGTTTIAMVYYHSKQGSTFFSEVFANPQIPYGADVISRIKYAVEHPENSILHNALIASLKEHISSFLCRYPDIHLKQCLIGGNTTMIHLLLNLSLRDMTGVPFTPAQIKNFSFSYKDVNVSILPWLSAFIGGDITAGILSLSFDKRNDTCLLADLGTNGELVLCHKGRLFTASTAAGPALEGGGLSHGCPAIPGAISEVSLRGLLPRIRTIGNKLPSGICGSGAISLLAELLSHGFMDTKGILSDKFPENGITLARSTSGTSILFTANDIRQMQLAIAAIAAGIDTLCHEAGISTHSIDSLFLAGGLGYFLPLEKAASLGMFCDIKRERIHCVGNSCLNGLAKLSKEGNTMSQIQSHLKELTTEVSLAENSYFQSSYIAHMSYPSDDTTA